MLCGVDDKKLRQGHRNPQIRRNFFEGRTAETMHFESDASTIRQFVHGLDHATKLIFIQGHTFR